MNRSATETPVEQGRDPTDLEEAILSLLESAGIESGINDEIMRLVEIGERRLEARNDSVRTHIPNHF